MKVVVSFFLFIVFTLTACKQIAMDKGDMITAYNSSSVPIVVKSGFEMETKFPDTSIVVDKMDQYVIVEKEQARTISYLNGYFDDFFRGKGIDTLSFFVFDAETLTKYPWDIIKTDYLVLARYDLSAADLTQLSGRLYYPPTEAMRNMKMYPKYDAE